MPRRTEIGPLSQRDDTKLLYTLHRFSNAIPIITLSTDEIAILLKLYDNEFGVTVIPVHRIVGSLIHINDIYGIVSLNDFGQYLYHGGIITDKHQIQFATDEKDLVICPYIVVDHAAILQSNYLVDLKEGKRDETN